jgi:KaiC/GvpD/RAD55 family RecA-like ATPase
LIDVSSTRAAAASFVSSGWRPIPIPHGRKVPTLKDWQRLRLGADDVDKYFGGGKPQNVGVLLGEPSAWLVDVDIDCPEARRLAVELLPDTITFGRASKPRSHYLYRAEGAQTRRYEDIDRAALVELRATGAQTVFPPSVHESGEAIRFDDEGGREAPLELAGADIRMRVAKLAAASLLVRHGRSEADAIATVTGRPAPIEDVPPAVASRVREWLGWGPAPAATVPPPPRSSAPAGAHPIEERLRRARAYLREIPSAVTGQGGHQQTWEAALAAVRGFDLPPPDAFQVLAEYNQRCQPPWSERELHHKLESAARDGRREPGYLLERGRPATSTSSTSSGPIPLAAAGGGAEPVPVAPAEPTRPWKTPAERALGIGYAGPRLSTSLATLNRHTRGGIPPTGKLIVIGGAPGAGKTSLACQEGFRWARAGVPVAFLASDEDADGIEVRIGQSLGISRTLLEEADPGARTELAEHMRQVPAFHLIDAEEEEVSTLEAVAERLASLRPPGEPAVLVVDSLQTVTALAAEKARDPRDKINLVLKTLKTIAKRYRLTVIVTSELARGAYREAQGKNGKGEVNLLAAFKESGAIEYGVTLAMVLRALEEPDANIEAVVVKNRLGGPRDKPTIRLWMDESRAEVTEARTISQDEIDAAEVRRHQRLREAIVSIIEKTVGVPLTNAKDIYGRITKGRGKVACRYPECVDAITELLEEGAIVKVDIRGEVINPKRRGRYIIPSDSGTSGTRYQSGTTGTRHAGEPPPRSGTVVLTTPVGGSTTGTRPHGGSGTSSESGTKRGGTTPNDEVDFGPEEG